MATGQILSRNEGTFISQVSDGSQTFSLTEPSIVRLNGVRSMVTSYERVGNDLILHMQDGTTVRYRSFFLEDAAGYHSELVFDDGTGLLDHAVFAEAAAPAAPLALEPTFVALDTLAPLEFAGSVFTPAVLAGLGAVAVGGGIAIAAGTGGGGGGGDDDDGTPGATPVLTLTPAAGDNQLNAAESQNDLTLTGTLQNAPAGSTVQATLNGVTYPGTIGADGSVSVTIPASALQGLPDGTSTIGVTITTPTGQTSQTTIPLTVDKTPPTLSVTPIAGDGVIDATEASQPLTVSGTASTSEAGQPVTVSFNGVTYSGTVAADGSWSLTIPAEALSGLADGGYLITTSLSDAAGNTTTLSQSVTLNASGAVLPTLTLNPFTGDNVLDATERQSDQTLSGTTSGIEAGQPVTVTLNGVTYSASVGTDGSWSVTVPAADLQALANGTTSLTATAANAAGQGAAASVELTVLVSGSEPSVTLNPFAGDNVLDGTESLSDQPLSGTTSGIEVGQTVTVTLNGATYTTTVGEGGSWSVTVPAADLQALTDGTTTLTASVTNAAGQGATASVDLTVATGGGGEPTVTLNPFAGDNVLDGTESQIDQPLSGTTTGIEVGQTVTVTLNGVTYTTTVGEGGSWSVTVPTADLQALTDGTTTLTASATNAAGQGASASVDLTVAIGGGAEPTLTLAPFAGDNVLDATESQLDQTLSGTTTNVTAGQVVLVTLGSNSYTAVVAQDGTWSVNVPSADLQALASGDLTLSAVVNTANGQQATASATITVEAAAVDPTLTLNPFTGDNILTEEESNSAQTLSGTTTGIEAGQTVTLTLNNKTYTATVGEDGSWSTTVPAADLALIPSGDATLTATVTTLEGTEVTNSLPLVITANGPDPVPTLSLDPFAGDNVLSGAESQLAQALTGTTTGVEAGQTVTLTLNGETYSALVSADGSWRILVPAADLAALAAGEQTLDVSVTNLNGQQATASQTLTVEAPAELPTIALNVIAGDNVLTSGEAQTEQLVNGTTTNVEAGQTVSVAFGTLFTVQATVQADGSWSAPLSASQLQSLIGAGDSLAVTATVTDQAGTPATASSNLIIQPDAPSITLDAFAGDNVLSGDEAAVAQTLSGTTTGVEAGQTVTLTLGGNSYTADVGEDGRWSVEVPVADLAGLVTGDLIAATVSNLAGVQASASNTLTVDAALPSLTLEPFAEDNILTDDETGTAQAVSGATTGVEAGQSVSVTLNGRTYTTTVNEDGSFTVDVPAADLLLLSNGQALLTATVTNLAGQSTSASEPVTVNFTTERLTLDPITADNQINAAEAAAGFTISGSAPDLAAGTPVTITLGDRTFTATVNEQGTWSAPVGANALVGLPDGTQTLTVSAPGSAPITADIGVFIQNQANFNVQVNAPFEDSVLTGTEAATDQLLTGSTGITGAGQNVVVTVNGINYTATVTEEGNWTVNIPAAALQAITGDTSQITVQATDVAGNTASGQASFDVAFGNAVVTLDPIAEDNRINATEAAAGINVTGNAGAEAAGLPITVALNGQNYSGTVNPDGSWSVPIPATDLLNLPDGTTSLTATLAGNPPASVDLGIFVQNLPAPITATPFEDGVLDADEAATDQIITGTTGVAGAGQTVSVNLGGTDYPATVDENGNWSATLPATALQALPEGTTPLTVTATDAAGNSNTATTNVEVDQVPAAITLDPLGGDNIVNADEAAAGLTVSGSTAGLAEGDQLTIAVGGQTYTTPVLADGTFSFDLPAEDVQNWTGNPLTLTVTTPDGEVTSVEIGNYVQNTLAPTLETPFGDNVLTAEEAALDQVLTGTTGATGAGQGVTVTLGDNSYTGSVDQAGNWSVTLPATDLQALEDGTATLTVTVTDAGGNTNSTDFTPTVAVTAPTLTLDAIAGDNLINFAEGSADITVSGTSSVDNGTVTVTLGTQTFTAQTAAGGAWSLTIPADTLTAAGAFPDGTYPLTATLTDANGNVTTATQDLVINADSASLPTLTIAGFGSGDTVLDGAEHQVAQTLSGTTTNVEAGQLVTLTLNEQTYTATVQGDGSWSVIVPADAVAALPAGAGSLTATVSDSAGNAADPATFDFSVEEILTSIAIDTISDDNRINALEANGDLIVQGATTNVPEDTQVALALGGRTYFARTLANGSWSVTVPAADVRALGDGPTEVVVTTTDAQGTTLTGTLALTLYVNPLPVATVDTPFGDGYLNAQEVTTDQVLTGRTGVTGAGQTVQVTLNGTELTGTVDNNGNWSVTVPAALLQAQSGDVAIAVQVADAAGNVSNAQATVTVDTTAPTVTLNALAGDDILNAAEQAVPLVISGTSSGGTAGQTVTVVLNGVSYSGEVQASGNWQVTVPATDLAVLTNGGLTVTATLTDAAGNPATDSRALTVNNTLGGLAFDTLSGDNALNATEAGLPLVISGTAVNVAAGSTVTITAGGETYTALVTNTGSWSTSIPATAFADGPNAITATVTDSAGTVQNATTSLDVHVTNLPQATLDPLPALNADTAQNPLVISGNTGVAGDGQSVTVTLNGQTYTGLVAGDGSWSATVPADDLADLPDDGYPVNVTVTDVAGNISTTAGQLVVDTAAPGLSLDPIAGDNIINAAELAAGITLSLTTEPNNLVTATINGQVFSTTADGNGAWSAQIPPEALVGLADGTYQVVVTSQDSVGNVTSVTQSFTLAATALPTLTLNAFAVDNVLDGAERSVDQLLSGTTTNVQPDQTVTVTLGSQTYTALVLADGSWNLTVPASDLQLLAAGAITLDASVSDLAGNPATATTEITVNTGVDSLAINLLSGDGYLNIDEAAAGLTVSGAATGVTGGATVTVTFNEQTYTAEVNGDGTWSVAIPGDALTGLADGAYTLTATTPGNDGTPITASQDLNVLINNPPVIVSDPAFGDGFLNITEAANGATLSGQTGVTGVGQSVSVNLGGQTFTGTVDENSLWRVDIPSDTLQTLTDGLVNYSVQVSDVAGNLANTTGAFTVDITPPGLNIGPLTADNIVNQTEAAGALTLSGTSADIPRNGAPGATVNVTLNGQSYSGTVTEEGTWSIPLEPGVLAGLPNGSYDIVASITDSAGNRTEVTSSVTLATDPASAPELVFNVFAGDDILNGAEQNTAQTLSGFAYNVEQGQLVTLTLNGRTYTAEVMSDNSWSVQVPANDLRLLTTGDVTVTGTVQDVAGNVADGERTFEVNLDLGGISLNTLAGDNRLNVQESAAGLEISGTTQGVAANTPVTITLGGQTYNATTNDQGNWSVIVPQTALVNLPDGPQTVAVSTTDAGGNLVSNSSTLTVFLQNLPQPTIDTPFGDGIVGSADAALPQTLTGNTGTTGAGQSVTVTLGGVLYDGTVDENGVWSVTIPAQTLNGLPDGTASIDVTVSDLGGNTASTSIPVQLDFSAPLLTLDSITGDNLLNAAEIASGVPISGTGSEVGQLVSVLFNGNTYTAEVQPGGAWSLTLPSTALANLADGPYTLSVTLTDGAGNPTTIDRVVTLDGNAANLPTLTIDSFAGDDIVNGAESRTAQLISGTTENVEAGRNVLITLGAGSYTAQVQAGGVWSVSVPAADLALVSNGAQTISATVTDLAGNPATATRDVTFNNAEGGLSIDPVTGDNLINAVEAAGAIVISGSSANVPEGGAVTLTFNGNEYTATVGPQGGWSVTVPVEDTALLTDGNLLLTATATDAGNTPLTASVTVGVLVDVLPAPTVDTPFADGLLSRAEATNVAGQSLSGTTGITGDGQRVTVTLGGQTITADVDSNGTWSATLPASLLSGLGEGPTTVTVNAIDAAGNSVPSESTFTVDFTPPTLTLQPISDDNVLVNTDTSTTVTGSSDAIGQTVVLTLFGVPYQTEVQQDGSYTFFLSGLNQQPNGIYPYSISVTDAAGNVTTLNDDLRVARNLDIAITRDAFTGDDVINGAEVQVPQIISGSTVGVEAGQIVTVNFNGTDYTTEVTAGGGWSLVLPQGALAGLANGDSVIIATSVSDIYGNTAAQSGSVTVNLDVGGIAFDPVSGDNFINANEATADVTLSGVATNVAQGAIVTLALDGQSYIAAVGPNGAWSITVLAADVARLPDGTVPLTASVTDLGGNLITQTVDIGVHITNLPAPVISSLFGDGVLNSADATEPQTISGNTGVAGNGQSVDVVLNNVTYNADVDPDGSWTVIIPSDDLQDLQGGPNAVTVTARDAAGNLSQTTGSVTVDYTAPVLVVNPVSDDNVLNGAEAQAAFNVSGTTDPAEAGRTVTVLLNSVTYQTEVQGDGSWSVTIPAGALAGVTASSVALSASLTDAAGNNSTVNNPLTLVTGTPLPQINTPLGDSYLGIAEASQPQILTGNSGVAGAGQTVTVTLNGATYPATTNEVGDWSVTLEPAVLQSLPEGIQQVLVNVTDAAGNQGSVQSALTVDFTVPVLNATTISGDNAINAAESTLPVTINGSTDPAESGQPVSVLFNGQTYTTLVLGDGSWSIDLPVEVVQDLADGTYPIEVTLTDAAGNISAPQTLTLTVDASDANLPTLTVTAVAGDNFINQAEATGDVIITGSSTNLEEGRPVTVTLNGLTYGGTVGVDGTWSVLVPQADIANLQDGAQTLTVTSSDASGNPANNIGEFTVAAQAASLPLITLNAVAGDGIINTLEAQADVIISGNSQRLPEGSLLTVTLSTGPSYQTQVAADGSWSVLVPPADVALSPSGTTLDISVTATNAAGNTGTGSASVLVDTATPVLSVNTSAGVDLAINQAEAAAGLTVNGTTEPNVNVAVQFNGTTYSVASGDDGQYSVLIPAGDLQLITANGPLPLTVSMVDASGNTNSQSVDLTVAFNALPTLTLDTPYTDGLVNITEATSDFTLTGSVTNLAAGSTVNVTLGGFTTTGTVNGDGTTWSALIPAGSLTTLGDGLYALQVSATDVYGNVASADTSVDLLVTTQPAIGFNLLFGDGLLNAAEATTDQVISGTTGLTGPGQTVALTLDGTAVDVTVDENGVWSATLTAAQLGDLADGTHTLALTASDRAGNSAQNSVDFASIVDTLPAPTFDVPFGDGIINAAEAAQGGEFTGTTGIVGTQTVTVNINGTLYTADVDTGTGAWRLGLPAEVLTALPDGQWPGTVTVTDGAGNSTTIGGSITVAINSLPQATLNAPFGDLLLNNAEATAGQTLTGGTGLANPDGTVTVTVSIDGGAPIAADVDVNGFWSLDLAPELLLALADGPHTLSVTASDFAGNNNTSTPLTFVASLSGPVPEIDTPFGDGLLSINEAAGPLTLTGNTGEPAPGESVQLTLDLNGVTYTGTVADNGDWTVTLPAGALRNLPDGQHELEVTITDQAGNTATETATFTSDQTAPQPAFSVASGTGILDNAAVANGATFTGTTGEIGAGQSVVLTLGTQTYTATVDENGNWSVPFAAGELASVAQGNQPLILTATDAAGNSATINDVIFVDTIVPTITVTAFSAGDTLDYLESFDTQTLTGTTANAEQGDTVTVSIGNLSTTGVLAADGSWSVNLTPAQLAGLEAAGGVINVSITDLAGNVGNTSLTVAVDLTPPPDPLLIVGAVGGDNIINGGDTTLPVTGSFANLPPDSTGTITLTLADGTVIGSVGITGAAGDWTAQIDATLIPEGNDTLTATLTTGAGQTLTGSVDVLVDRTPPTLVLNPFTGDNVVNANEENSSQTISGTASTSEAGQIVSITFNGTTYRAAVQANGNWSVNVSSGALQALDDGTYPMVATLSDAAGNVTSQSQDVVLDTSAPLITVDALLGDNILNAADILIGQVLTGTAVGAEGQTIGLYLGDANPIATAVVQPNGTFTLDLTPEVLGSLTEGTLVFGLRVNDVAGNQTDATLTVNKVINQALNLVVDSVFGDNTLNALDTTVAQTISGVATSAGVGATVSVNLGGTNLTAAVGQNGQWAIVVPPSVLQALTDGDLAVNVTLTDAAGNSRSVSQTVTTIINNVPVIGDLTGLFGGDNLLNVAEAAVNQTVSGVVSAATGSTVNVTLGTRNYQGTVAADGSFNVLIPAVDLATLAVGNTNLGVTVVDPAGNVASTTASIGVFNLQPTITLNPIFGNGILNAADALVNQTISGVVANAAPGSTVTLAIGNSTVNAAVGNNGTFTATVAPDILGTLLDGPLTVNATLNGAAGNTATTSGLLTVDVTPPVITLNPLFGDGLLNAADALVTQTLSGVVSGAGAGARVAVTIGNQQLVTTTAADGSFNLGITPSVLRTLTDGNLSVGVTVTDAAGNSSSTSGTALVGITNLPTLTVDPLFGGDNVLSLVESLVTQTVSGTVTNAAAGTTVNINVGNITTTAAVGQDGRFSAALTPDILGTLLNGNLTLGVSLSDPVGNVASFSTGVRVGTSPTTVPTVTLNTIFGDGVLSAADLNTAQTISGTTTNAATGSNISVTLGGATYTTTVGSSGTWSLTVPTSALATLANGNQAVAATVTNTYGNTATANGSVSVIAQTAPTVTLTSVFGDNAISAADSHQAQTISGTTTNAEGSTVRVTLGTQTFTTTVASNGSWSLSVPSTTLIALADGNYNVTASVTNAANLTGSSSAAVQVITHTTPTVTLNSFFGGDGYLNLSEANAGQTISGTSTNAAGGTATVTVAGVNHTATVAANGTWSVTLAPAELRAISDGAHTVSVTLSDAAGNTAAASRAFTADVQTPPEVGVYPLTSLLGVLLTGLTVAGPTRNLAAGSTVRVNLQGIVQTGTVDAFGNYSVHYSGGLLTQVGVTLLSTVTVSAVDVAGNTAAVTTSLLLGSLLSEPAVAATTLAAVTTDDVSALSTEEAGTVTLSAFSVAAEGDSSQPESTLTTALATPDTSSTTAETGTAAEETAYSIGGMTLDLSTSGGEAVGGSGNDTIALYTLDFSHIDGGAGTDTLLLAGTEQHLDLVALGLKVEHIEIFDLGQSGTNSITLNLNEAQNVKDAPADTLLIKGADGSQVNLAGDGGTWANTGERVVDGMTFDVYHNNTLDSSNTLADVLVQHGIQVHQV
ncbi:Ig-like domain-containing protein [Nissabacter sp. SGAir0207]|uniref:Ig-like domain-containing protein n=1 Tax=Nissabacter sp. SGAir0207 TaxID=2126321 RepID=UPI00143CE910|nr:Ig-like domain-containing protein [Nissabacter sp. SGAir0207]